MLINETHIKNQLKYLESSILESKEILLNIENDKKYNLILLEHKIKLYEQAKIVLKNKNKKLFKFVMQNKLYKE